MTSLFPGLSRTRKEEIKDIFAEDAVLRTSPVECETCGIKREDWTFDCLSVCKKCGDIMERPIDSGAEYRYFGIEDRGGGDPCRVGAPIDSRFPTSGLGTMILSHATGGNSSTRIAMARVRRYHTWNLLPYRERSLLQVFEQIALTATNHGFDQRTMDIGKDMYVKLVEHDGEENQACNQSGILHLFGPQTGGAAPPTQGDCRHVSSEYRAVHQVAQILPGNPLYGTPAWTSYK